MKKEILYWIVIIAACFAPTFGFHYLIRPFWYNGGSSSTNAPLIEIAFTAFFLPIYLLGANYFLSSRFKQQKYFLVNSIFSIACIFISSKLGFSNWADWSGNRVPDDGTQAVMNFEKICGIIILIIGLTAIFIRLFKKGTFKLES